MSIDLKPYSLEYGRNFTVLNLGASKKQVPLQTIHFKVWWHIVFLINIIAIYQIFYLKINLKYLDKAEPFKT